MSNHERTRSEFPVLRESLELLQRHYDELNSSLESTNNRAGVSLAAVAALTGLTIFQAEIVSAANLQWFGRFWLLALITAATGYVFLLLSGYQLIRCLRVRTAKSPYNIEELATQPAPNYRDAILYYSRQLGYHRLSIKQHIALLDEKGRHLNAALQFAVIGFLLLAAVRAVGFVIAIVLLYA